MICRSRADRGASFALTSNGTARRCTRISRCDGGARPSTICHLPTDAPMQRRHALHALLASALLAALPTGTALAADAAPFKIGFILPMTGQSASTGKQIEAAAKLYLAQNGSTYGGRKVELIIKDDAGVADTTRRVAQELIVNDKVDVLAGFGLTPLAL